MKMSGSSCKVLFIVWLGIPLGIISFVEIELKANVTTQWVRHNAILSCEFRSDVELELEDLKVIWERIDQNKSVTELESRGRVQKEIGRDKRSGNFRLEIQEVTEADQGDYLCLININGSIDYGKRTLQVNSPKGYGIKAGHERYSVTLGSDVLIYCYLQDQRPPYYGWTKEVFPAPKDSRHQMEMRIGGVLTYLIKDLQEKDLGTYRCEYKNNTAMGFGEIEVSKGRAKRAIDAVQKLQITHPNPQENLIVGLIRDFGTMQNVSKITACLPLPQAAGEPIPWGIIVVGLPPEVSTNSTKTCEVVIREWKENVQGCQLLKAMTEQECRKKRDIIPGQQVYRNVLLLGQ